MHRRLRHFLTAVAGLYSIAAIPAVAAPAAEGEAFFERRIRPVLTTQCQSCHGAKVQRAGLRLDSASAMKQVVGPGAPAASPLMQALRHTGKVKMPPQGKLPDAQIADFDRWVAMGAPWPKGSATPGVRPKAEEHWSFRPVRLPKAPKVKQAAWVKSPIDAFILARLEARNLTPARPADKRSLIRRSTFDLTGLPPTPEEIDAFLQDRSSNAFEKVVDRLLASPRYGERWGRHWLDVVRYSDTAGNPPDFPVPQAYRYRDYVINALNADRPYDQFLREQIAGDLLGGATDAEKHERIVATGYLAIGRRFSLLGENGPDHLELEDVIDTVGRSVLGLSLSCARCHDHKFDPVSQTEYYALYGIFKSTRFPFPGAEGVAKQKDFVPLAGSEDAYAVVDGKPANAKVQIGGDPGKQADEVPRGFLSVLGRHEMPKSLAGSGRFELAQWLTDPANPLTPRVIVNRVWQGHFGRGLVSTPSDFGTRGTRPSHPELLDWLASVFVAPHTSDASDASDASDSVTRKSAMAWSLKRLHRLILLSSTYQQASVAAKPVAHDPNNELLWKYPRRRLDAETVRDALLAVSGELDLTPAGPHPFPPKDQWGEFSQHRPFVAAYETKRRSVYLMQQRLRRHPYLSLFDGADPNTSTGSRLVTTTPIQALFMMNDPQVHRAADRLAERMMAAGSNDGERLYAGYRLALGRTPEPVEVSRCVLHLANVRASAKGSEAEQTRAAWTSLARVLLASSEFLYVD